MPTYTYKCSKCSHQFEQFHSITENGNRPCPECSGESTRVIMGGAGLIFKGSGWYETDYKGKNASLNGNGKSKKHESSDSSGVKETKESKQDSKEKVKAEAK